MAIKLSDLKLYGSAVMPDDEVTTQIGGAIDRTKRMAFADVNGAIQVLSSSSTDTAVSMTVHYRDSGGALLSEAKTLGGTTPVAFTAIPERLMKGIKSGASAGDIAVEAQTATRTGTIAGASLDDITLDAGASAVNDFYVPQIVRLPSGPGADQIRQAIAYDGATKKLTIDHPYTTHPSTSVTAFRIAPGFFFEKTPVEVLQVRRIHYNAAADAPGGVNRDFFEKMFFENRHASQSLAAAQVVEASDPSGLLTFGLAATINDTGDNGVGNNRQVAPAGITFDSATKNVPGNELRAGSTIGVWSKLTLVAGALAQKTSYTPRLTGTTI